MIEQAIGLGLVLSLIFSEIFGLAAGGMVVPGYMAMRIHEPHKVLGTLIVSLATFGVVRFLSNFMFIYGRRRTVITILFGFLFGWVSRTYWVWNLAESHIEFEAIGYIIPGLVAIWMERQGVVATISIMLTAACLVRIILMVVTLGRI